MNKSNINFANNWYVLYTYPNFEKKVYNYLNNKKIRSFLPLQKVVRQWSDRKKTLEVPLFPNYIFVYVNMINRYKALEVPGVVRYVSFESKPVSLSDDEINTIKRLMDAPADILSIENILEKGDIVDIIEGPFAGLSGTLFDRKGKKRIGIKIPYIDKSLSIEICSSQVKKKSVQTTDSVNLEKNLP